MREKKKGNTNQASTSWAPPKEPAPQEENIVDDDNFWDKLHIEGDKTRGEKATPQEEAKLKARTESGREPTTNTYHK